MNSAFRTALMAALLLGAAAITIQEPASGQRNKGQPAQPRLKLDKAERTAVAPLQAAIAARNWAGASAALPAAQAGARTSIARYVVARLQLQLGLETQNVGMQSQAIDTMISSGVAEPSELPALLQNQAALVARGGDLRRTEAAYSRLVEADPNNVQALVDLARMKVDVRKPFDAPPLIERAIAIRETAGQRPPESWYTYGLRLAVDNKQAAQANRIGARLAAAYPTPENWRDVLMGYSDLAQPGQPSGLDVWRLMRAARALAGERDYMAYAQAANGAGLAAEAKAVLDEGVSKRMVDPAKAGFKELIASSGKKASADRGGLGAKQSAAMAAATGAAALSAGDAYFSYGDYTGAAALYRAAIQKGGADPAAASVRLGAALALAGQRAEAEMHLRSVTGPGADLAAYWLAWLRRPA
jgi:tetratricopeptide (TPR) repeat protein